MKWLILIFVIMIGCLAYFLELKINDAQWIRSWIGTHYGESSTPLIDKSQFQNTNLGKFDWLLGKWIGKGEKSNFYEEYILVNDTLIMITYYGQDSTFKNIKETGKVYLSKGKIYHRYGQSALWKAVVKSEEELRFKPVSNANNTFIWKRTESGWNAILGDNIFPMAHHE